MDPEFLRKQQARVVRANRIKLVLMVVALVALAAGMLRLASKPRGKAADGEEEQPVSTEVEDRSPPLHLIGEGKTPGPLAVSEEEVRKQFPFIVNDEVLEQIKDRGTTIEPGPFFRILYRVFQDKPGDLKAEAFTDVPWSGLWEDPEPMRGEVIVVRGEIVRIWRQPLGKNPMGLDKVWAYRIREKGAPRDRPDHFFDVYAIEKLFGALPYDEVTAYGRLLKTLVDRGKVIRRTKKDGTKEVVTRVKEDGTEEPVSDPDLHVAVVLARRFEPLTYLDEPRVPKPVRPGTRPEARALYYLLRRARDTSFEQLEATASDKPTYLDFMNHADRYCGKPVVIEGELRRCVRMSLPENVLRLPDVYYGQVVDADRKMNTFYALHIPDGLRLKDPVLVYGYYLKNWSYVSQGDRVISSPVIAAQRLVVLEYEKSYTLEIILGAIVTGTVGLLLVAYSRERASQLALNEARRQRQLSRLPENLNEVARQLTARAEGSKKPPSPDEAE